MTAGPGFGDGLLAFGTADGDLARARCRDGRGALAAGRSAARCSRRPRSAPASSPCAPSTGGCAVSLRANGCDALDRRAEPAGADVARQHRAAGRRHARRQRLQQRPRRRLRDRERRCRVGSRGRESDGPQRARALGRRQRGLAGRRQRRLRRRLSRPRRRHRSRDRRRALAAGLVVVRGLGRRLQQRLRDERLRCRHCARSREAGTQVWRQEALRLRDVTAPTRYANTLVVGDYEGYLHWLSPDDGSFLARERAAGERIPPRRSSSGRTSTCRATTAPWPRSPCATTTQLKRRRHAARRGARRPTERRQIDAVQSPDRHARRARRGLSRASRATAATASARAADRKFIVIDTGGLVSGRERRDHGARRRAGRDRDRGSRRRRARRRSQERAHGRGRAIAERLRRESKPVVIAVNKAEGVPGELAEAEFHALGLGAPVGIVGDARAGRRRAARAPRSRRSRPTTSDPPSETSTGRRSP